MRFLLLLAFLSGCAHEVKCSVGENLVTEKDGRKHCVMVPIGPKQ